MENNVKLKKNNLENWCVVNNNKILLKEWDYERNIRELKITPKEISAQSSKKVFWRCKEGHSWQTSVYLRTKYNHKCIYCTNQKVLKGFNDFEKWCLDNNKKQLLEEWDYEKNLNKPFEYTKCSGKKVFWKCSKLHGWEATIAHRVRENTGCPTCKNKKLLKGYNDLRTLRSDIAEEWHPTKNNNKMPEDFLVGSYCKVWWRCKKGHEWQATIEARTRKIHSTGCAICSKKKLCRGENDLMTYCNTHFETKHLLNEWDYQQNIITPEQIVATSDKKVWWTCQNNHKWAASVGSRVKGNRCPKCNSNTSFPEQAILFYISRVFKNTHSRYITNKIELDVFIPELNVGIEYDGYYFHNDTEKKERAKNEICKDNKIRLIRVREKGLPLYSNCECIIRKENNSDNSLNDVIRKLLNLLNVKCTVNVEKDKIEIMQQYKRYLKNESLELLYPNLVLDWDCEKNRGLKLSNFTKGSHTKVHWKCAKCGNTWIAEIKSRVSGSGCELCSRQNAIKARSCKVLNIDTNTIYASLTEAQRLTGVERHSIANCCKGKTKMAGGFQWRHV